MGFGLKYIQGADQDQQRVRSKMEGADDDTTQAPSTPVASTPAPAVRAASKFQRAPKTDREGSSTASNPIAPSASSVQPAPFSPPVQPNSLKARRLVQEVGEFKKWPLDKMLAEERRALNEPEKVFEEYFPVFRDEVKVARAKGCRTLEEALSKHSQEVVFLVVKGEQQSLRTIPKADAAGQAILHGAIVESVSAHTTFFPPPSSFKSAPDVAPPKSPKP